MGKIFGSLVIKLDLCNQLVPVGYLLVNVPDSYRD
jgi:hypothetical protein